MKTALIYYFKTANPAHVQTYVSNFENYSGNVTVKLLDLKNPRSLFHAHDELSFNSSVPKISVFYVPSMFQSLFLILYVICFKLNFNNVTVIFKKTPLPKGWLLRICKDIFKINLTIELEGDIKAEADYLRTHPSPFSTPAIPSEATSFPRNHAKYQIKLS